MGLDEDDTSGDTHESVSVWRPPGELQVFTLKLFARREINEISEILKYCELDFHIARMFRFHPYACVCAYVYAFFFACTRVCVRAGCMLWSCGVGGSGRACLRAYVRVFAK